MRYIPIILIAIGLLVTISTGWYRHLSLSALAENSDWLQTKVASWGWMAALAMVGLYIVVTAFSIPGAVFLTLATGFLFGIFWGTIFVVFAATIGASLVFLAARSAFGEVLRARAGKRLLSLAEGFKANAFNYLLFLRLVPIFPFWLVNLAPAFLGARLSTFIVATAIGIFPGSLVYISVGNGLGTVLAMDQDIDLGIIFRPALFIPLVALASLSVLPVLAQRLRKRKTPKSV